MALSAAEAPAPAAVRALARAAAFGVRCLLDARARQCAAAERQRRRPGEGQARGHGDAEEGRAPAQREAETAAGAEAEDRVQRAVAAAVRERERRRRRQRQRGAAGAGAEADARGREAESASALFDMGRVLRAALDAVTGVREEERAEAGEEEEEEEERVDVLPLQVDVFEDDAGEREDDLMLWRPIESALTAMAAEEGERGQQGKGVVLLFEALGVWMAIWAVREPQQQAKEDDERKDDDTATTAGTQQDPQQPSQGRTLYWLCDPLAEGHGGSVTKYRNILRPQQRILKRMQRAWDERAAREEEQEEDQDQQPAGHPANWNCVHMVVMRTVPIHEPPADASNPRVCAEAWSQLLQLRREEHMLALRSTSATPQAREELGRVVQRYDPNFAWSDVAPGAPQRSPSHSPSPTASPRRSARSRLPSTDINNKSVAQQQDGDDVSEDKVDSARMAENDDANALDNDRDDGRSDDGHASDEDGQNRTVDVSSPPPAGVRAVTTPLDEPWSPAQRTPSPEKRAREQEAQLQRQRQQLLSDWAHLRQAIEQERQQNLVERRRKFGECLLRSLHAGGAGAAAAAGSASPSPPKQPPQPQLQSQQQAQPPSPAEVRAPHEVRQLPQPPTVRQSRQALDDARDAARDSGEEVSLRPPPVPAGGAHARAASAPGVRRAPPSRQSRRTFGDEQQDRPGSDGHVNGDTLSGGVLEVPFSSTGAAAADGLEERRRRAERYEQFVARKQSERDERERQREEDRMRARRRTYTPAADDIRTGAWDTDSRPSAHDQHSVGGGGGSTTAGSVTDLSATSAPVLARRAPGSPRGPVVPSRQTRRPFAHDGQQEDDQYGGDGTGSGAAPTRGEVLDISIAGGNEEERRRRMERYEQFVARKQSEQGERERQREERLRGRRRTYTPTAGIRTGAWDSSAADLAHQQLQQPPSAYDDHQHQHHLHHQQQDHAHQHHQHRSHEIDNNDRGSGGHGGGASAGGGDSRAGASRGGGGGGGGGLVHDDVSELSMPPLRKKILPPSNRRLVKNALTNVCLAGAHFEEQKAEVFSVLDSYPAQHFVILVAHHKVLAFRGLYTTDDADTGSIRKIYGRGPAVVHEATIMGYYKYNSASRQFDALPAHSMTSTTDAVSILVGRSRSAGRARPGW